MAAAPRISAPPLNLQCTQPVRASNALERPSEIQRISPTATTNAVRSTSHLEMRRPNAIFHLPRSLIEIPACCSEINGCSFCVDAPALPIGRFRLSTRPSTVFAHDRRTGSRRIQSRVSQIFRNLSSLLIGNPAACPRIAPCVTA